MLQYVKLHPFKNNLITFNPLQMLVCSHDDSVYDELELLKYIMTPSIKMLCFINELKTDLWE
jgi:hypothetical protein